MREQEEKKSTGTLQQNKGVLGRETGLGERQREWDRRIEGVVRAKERVTDATAPTALTLVASKHRAHIHTLGTLVTVLDTL